MQVYPTEFKCFDYDGEPIFMVRSPHEEAAQIQIDAFIDVEAWDKIAPLIRFCLIQMRSGDAA